MILACRSTYIAATGAVVLAATQKNFAQAN
jgi:hypothetical protein